jgi:hypothetical protein
MVYDYLHDWSKVAIVFQNSFLNGYAKLLECQRHLILIAPVLSGVG